jgi:CBS domain containing-hemolysin-like protein
MKENPSRPASIKVVETSPSDALVVSPQRGRGLVHKQNDDAEDKGFFGKRKRKSGPTEEHIKRVLFENLDAFPSNEVRMLRGVFSLSTTAVREVMIPLSELVAVHVNTPTEQVKAMAESANYRFVPVFEERIDRLIGVIDVMELLYTPREFNDVSTFTRRLERVPETKPAGELLEELSSSTEPVAAVIGEHAGCTGFVTIEDIIELIVGEIRYNHKRHTPHAELLGNDHWSLDARTSIDVVNDELGADIPKDRCDTIGGFILAQLGRLPERGEKVIYDNIEFMVEDVFGYGIISVQATRVDAPGKTKKRSR